MSQSENYFPLVNLSNDGGQPTPSSRSAANPQPLFASSNSDAVPMNSPQPGAQSALQQSAVPLMMAYGSPMAMTAPSNAAVAVAPQPGQSAAPTYYMAPAPQGSGFPPGAMVYMQGPSSMGMPMGMPVPVQVGSGAPMVPQLSQPMQPTLQPQQQLQPAPYAMYGQPMGMMMYGSNPAASGGIASPSVSGPWGPASERSRRNIWLAMLGLAFIAWAFAIIGTAAPSVIQCKIRGSKYNMGYWQSCTGGTCYEFASSAASQTPSFIKAAEAFSILYALSSTVVIALVCLVYKTFTNPKIMRAIAIFSFINLICGLIALAVFAGEEKKLSSSYCTFTLDYAGGMTVVVLVFDLIISVLALKFAKPAVASSYV